MSLAPKRAALERGRRAEEIAAAYLNARGLQILHRNFRRRLGELDLVVRDGAELVIVEVRTRSTNAYGGAAASIDSRTRQRMVRATLLLLQRHKDLARMRIRFDAVLVSNVDAAEPTVQWIRHAFTC